VDPSDADAPTREEAVQTLLGVARMLGGEVQEEATDEVGDASGTLEEAEPTTPGESSNSPAEHDPDQVSFEFAQGYDEGYQMGRRVGLALGARKRSG
jgi:hypothetical protein